MIRHQPCAFAIALGISLPSLAIHSTFAASGDSAKGTLTVETQDKPASVELAHAYLISGPDSFDEKKMTRRIVFTKSDERATIEACEHVSCATLSSSDGMTIDLPEGSAPNWWAHVHPVQYSGTEDADALKLSVDTPERLAGSFKISTSAVSASIVFDAPLVKSFPK